MGIEFPPLNVCLVHPDDPADAPCPTDPYATADDPWRSGNDESGDSPVHSALDADIVSPPREFPCERTPLQEQFGANQADFVAYKGNCLMHMYKEGATSVELTRQAVSMNDAEIAHMFMRSGTDSELKMEHLIKLLDDVELKNRFEEIFRRSH